MEMKYVLKRRKQKLEFIYNIVTNLRLESTWKMEESEETSLKWAAIQRLPTVARLRRGLLTTPNGDSNEIDVHNIGLQERTYLLQRLVTHDVDTDDSFLLKLMRDRYDRYVYVQNNARLFFSSSYVAWHDFITELELVFLQLKFDFNIWMSKHRFS